MTSINEHCDAARTLQQAGLSQTAQRMAVLEIVIQADGPLSAADILGRTDPAQKISKVTVYRILSSFKQRRIIRELPTDQGMNLYEMACRHNPVHPHFYCRACRTMACLPPLTLSQTMDWFALPDVYCVEDVRVHLSGLCRLCRERK